MIKVWIMNMNSLNTNANVHHFFRMHHHDNLHILYVLSVISILSILYIYTIYTIYTIFTIYTIYTLYFLYYLHLHYLHYTHYLYYIYIHIVPALSEARLGFPRGPTVGRGAGHCLRQEPAAWTAVDRV